MSYEEALALVNGLESRPWRHGLDRMRALVSRAGLDSTLTERGYIHIAGTNGKGTTTAFVESILRHQGHRTGAFFSPYVVDYRERIQAEGHLIERDELVRLVERLLPMANSLAETEFGGASKFELEAAMGLAYWQEKRCGWVALEVGLGGRLDATNVVTPKACVITSIGLDHTAILGNSLAEIAAEKAGIIKPGVPVVVGQMAEEPFAVIERTAEVRGAPLWRVGREVRFEEGKEALRVQTPVGEFSGREPTLGGIMSSHNAAVAVAACAAAVAIQAPESVADGVAAAWLPGRNDVRLVDGRALIFDGAHNEDAARVFVSSLPPSVVLVTNMLAGHEVEAFYRRFLGRAIRAEVPPVDSPRAMAVHDTVAMLRRLGVDARGHTSVTAALDAAIAAEGDALVVVTGSNYLVGEALRLVG